MRPILVVDDDPRIGRAIQGWLRYCGFRIQLSASSAGGVTALDQFGFDLTIVDVFTPDLGGFEPIRLFHAQAAKVPLTAIAGATSPLYRGLKRDSECAGQTEIGSSDGKLNLRRTPRAP